MRSPRLLSLALAVLAAPAAAQDITVYHVALRGPVRTETARVVARALELAAYRGTALIVEIDSAGHDLRYARTVAGELDASEVPVFAYVARAALDGAFWIALTADTLFVAPTASLGADTGPSASGRDDEEDRAALRTGLRAGLTRRGIDGRLADAVTDRRAAVGLPAAFTGDLAVERGIAAGRAGDLGGMLEQLQLAHAKIATVDADWLGTTVSVANNNWQNVRVFVVRGTSRFRLGTVTSNRAQTFRIPDQFVTAGARIHLRAEVIGSSESVTTEQMTMEPGLVVEWNIENVLSWSNYFIWERY